MITKFFLSFSSTLAAEGIAMGRGEYCDAPRRVLRRATEAGATKRGQTFPVRDVNMFRTKSDYDYAYRYARIIGGGGK